MTPLERLQAAYSVQDLKAHPKAILVNLAFRDGSGGACPSVATMSADTGISVRGVQRALTVLAERGLVTRKERGPCTAPQYRLDYAKMVTAPPVTVSPPDKVTGGDTVSPPPRQGVTPPPTQCHPNQEENQEENQEAPQTPQGAAPKKAAPKKKLKPSKHHHWSRAWEKPATRPKDVSRADLEAMALQCIAAITGKQPDPKCSGTASKPIFSLYKALGKPDPKQFAADLDLVARAARECPNRLFSRDIRGEGWEDAADRSRSVPTLCVQRRWDERLLAAQEWLAKQQAPQLRGPAFDPAAAAVAQLEDAARSKGFRCPPRKGQSGRVLWTFPPPVEGVDPNRWDEAVNAGLRAAGGWASIFARDDFERRQTLRAVAKTVAKTWSTA